MSVTILTPEDVHRLLPMRECISVMEQALADLQRGAVTQPLRSFWLPPGVNGATYTGSICIWLFCRRTPSGRRGAIL